MPQVPYIPPSFKTTSFNCPFCNAYASQVWFQLEYFAQGHPDLDGAFANFCSHCKKYSLWHNGVMVYPNFAGVEPPNQDLAADIQIDYMEAGGIVQKSPRGAAALLRLAVQKLCIQLGEKGKDINTDIAELVKKGLPTKVQQSLDALRVIGNEAVHPGQLDLKDDSQTAISLFKLVNFIAEKLITEPKEVEDIFNLIPESKKQQIEKRDGTK